MEQLSPQDSQFLYVESANNLSHVTSITIYDPASVPGKRGVRFKDVIDHVRGRLDTSPIFRRKLQRVPMELDYPYWVDDEYFDIEAHMIHGRLPEPGDWRQFCILLSRYHSRPMDMHRPLWEMYVVEGLDNIKGLPAGCYAIATKVHHAAVDGASLMRFFNAMSDIDAQGTPVEDLAALKALQPAEQPGLLEMGLRATLSNLRSPMRMLGAAVKSAPGLQQLAREALSASGHKKDPVPATRFDVSLSPHKIFDATEIALDDARVMRKLVPGATVNDVVLAVCSGALRRYLQHHDELPPESLVAWVPINARPGGASDTDAPGNNISAMTVPIHTGIEDPVERLAAITHSTQEGKNAKSGVAARLLTELTKNMPSTTQLMATQLLLRSGVATSICNLFVSNVAGSRVPLYMNGAKALSTYGMAPLGEGMGLFIATPSYAGKLGFNVISTREIMPDIDFFIECLQASSASLMQAITPPPAKKAKTARKAAAPRKQAARRKSS